MSEKKQKRVRRHKRIRAKISGTKERPRLCVFYSNRHIYAQLIDDGKGMILASANDLHLESKTSGKTQKHTPKKAESSAAESKDIIRAGKVLVAYEVGKSIAEKALGKKIEKVIFDRGGYKYHGKIKALAEGAREGGLKF